ncbi:hypothetical protein BTA51_00760 [Hahella sp. CCB-MM4]|uniref:PA4575 family protein n=1 Tax=Hahella sp. (strain CCB-MM4) TaxID=1926491 RepID=UPI000B9B1E67|nr:hypothetical protein [Hahella sp. CCB-MM4]OZG74965.1 hypothetical protein BTA51_00760 [Hahella sp. CCB-MM4]
MRLDFAEPLYSDPKFCALIHSDGKRVEVHLVAGDEHFYLVALSGLPNRPASRSKVQGPYISQPQAKAAMNAIVNSLLERGFEQLVAAKPIWTLQVKAEMKAIDHERSMHLGNYRFNPDDVYF